MTERKLKIGIMGGARGEHSKETLEKARALGEKIAESGCMLFYGATIGVPLAAAEGAQESGGFVVGVSPASNEEEHLEKFKLPLDAASTVIYTGFGFSGRNTILVRSCDAIMIVDGRVGTMIEFGVAYAERKVIGVLTGTGGIADKAKELEELFAGKEDTKIIHESCPEKLVETVLAEVNRQNP